MAPLSTSRRDNQGGAHSIYLTMASRKSAGPIMPIPPLRRPWLAYGPRPGFGS